jgi:hypothetical protein
LLDADELPACIAPKRLVASETPMSSGGGIALSIDLAGDKDSLSAIAASITRRLSTSTSAPPRTCSISGSRSTIAAPPI